ncbi:MAG: cell division protein ZapA [Gemmatimonadaceae bacterium]
MTTAKKHTLRVSILNEEYNIRSDRPPEHARAVAHYLDQAIRKVMSGGAIVEPNRAVVLAALQITAELFDAKTSVEETNESVRALSEYVRPLLPPAKRKTGPSSIPAVRE